MRQIKRVEEMKEIRTAGTIKINFNHPMQLHMKNISNKFNDLVDAINKARKDGYNIKVDFSKLEKEDY